MILRRGSRHGFEGAFSSVNQPDLVDSDGLIQAGAPRTGMLKVREGDWKASELGDGNGSIVTQGAKPGPRLWIRLTARGTQQVGRESHKYAGPRLQLNATGMHR